MATSITIEAASGYPTKTSMRVDVSFAVTYAASYSTEFEVRRGSKTGTLVDSATGSTFAMSANSSKSGIYKTFSGLSPGTRYTIIAYLCNASTGVQLVSDYLTFTTEADIQQTIIYHSGANSRNQTIQGDGNLADGNDLFTAPSGFTFYGWAESTGTYDRDYAAGASYTATSSSNKNLYAIWRRYESGAIIFYYGVAMASRNTRNLLAWAYNTSSTRQTTVYESVQSPAMTAGNITVLGRSFSPVGWSSSASTISGSGLISGGSYVTPSASVTTFYAVYQNTAGILVSYNANGGSGSMSSSRVAGTLYYNTFGKNSTITVTPRDSTFTPPTGKQFKGWATSAGGDIVTSISTAYDIAFYAQWGSARPQNWSWSGYLTLNGTRTAYNMTPGGKPPMVQQTDGSYYVYYMGAVEWNNLRARVQEFADYLGVTLNYLDYNGSSAQAGQPMTRKQAQCMADMINSLDPPKAVPTLTNDICVSFFTGLRDSLNSIP